MEQHHKCNCSGIAASMLKPSAQEGFQAGANQHHISVAWEERG